MLLEMVVGPGAATTLIVTKAKIETKAKSFILVFARTGGELMIGGRDE